MTKWEKLSEEEQAAEYDRILKEIDHKLALELNAELDAYDKIIARLKERTG